MSRKARFPLPPLPRDRSWWCIQSDHGNCRGLVFRTRKMNKDVRYFTDYRYHEGLCMCVCHAELHSLAREACLEANRLNPELCG